MHHAQMHRHNSFITLTYNDEHLETQSLNHRHFQLFMKSLRERLSRSSDNMQSDLDPITSKPACSYYMAGEYGSRTRRPHFHACLFGIEFTDKKYWRKMPSGSRLYTSDTLDQIWKKGFTSIGDVNFESAAYIARYILAKRNGQQAERYYEHVNDQTGEITDLLPEYNRMSLKTPIGKTWLEKYTTDVYPEGQVLIKNNKTKSPKYYDKQYKKKEKEKYEEMKKQREIQAMKYRNDNTPQRLKAKERVKLAQINQLLRTIP